MPWNTIKNEDDRPLLEYQLEKVVRGFFDPELFLDYMRYFVLFEDDGDSLIKKIAGYHQFHGVREAVRATTIAAADSDDDVVRERRATYGDVVQPGSRKAGVFWHTSDAKESRNAQTLRTQSSHSRKSSALSATPRFEKAHLRQSLKNLDANLASPTD